MHSAYLIHLAAQIVILACVWLSGTELWAVILFSVGATFISFILGHSHLKQHPQPWMIFLKKDFQFVMLPVLLFSCVTWLWPSTQIPPADFWFRLALNERLYKPQSVYRLASLEAKPEVQKAFAQMRSADVCELKSGLRSAMKDRYPSRLLTCHPIPEFGRSRLVGEGSDVVYERGGGGPFLIFKFRGEYVLAGKGKHGEHTAEQTIESITYMASRMQSLIQKERANEQGFQQREQERRQQEQEHRDKAAKSFE